MSIFSWGHWPSVASAMGDQERDPAVQGRHILICVHPSGEGKFGGSYLLEKQWESHSQGCTGFVWLWPALAGRAPSLLWPPFSFWGERESGLGGLQGSTGLTRLSMGQAHGRQKTVRIRQDTSGFEPQICQFPAV